MYTCGLQELLVERIWAAAQHPKWLVFEVEGQLQIRPDQFHHAKELLAHTKDSSEPGPITQLNMGEGKTRVILPMLALEWADQSCVVSAYWQCNGTYVGGSVATGDAHLQIIDDWHLILFLACLTIEE